MSETTLTENQEGAAEALPSTQPSAEATTQQTQTDPNGTVEAGAATTTPEDPNLEWAKTVGIDPNDPEALNKAIKIARDNQREFRTQQQEAKATLNDTATDAVQTGDPAQDQINQLQISVTADRFLNGLRRQGLSETEIDTIDGKMADVIKQRPHLAMDLDAAYAVVTRDSNKQAVQSAKEEGREAAKAEIARSSAAHTSGGNASSGAPAAQKWTRAGIVEMSATEFEKHRDEINAAIAAGELT